MGPKRTQKAMLWRGLQTNLRASTNSHQLPANPLACRQVGAAGACRTQSACRWQKLPRDCPKAASQSAARRQILPSCPKAASQSAARSVASGETCGIDKKRYVEQQGSSRGSHPGESPFSSVHSKQGRCTGLRARGKSHAQCQVCHAQAAAPARMRAGQALCS